ncbi:MAG: SAM-dependent methyltransferase [wastewater metagenome]|nr:SAM-dependent methyltransferase [Candidatus Loosdrechtia aerotolerans]
MSNRTLFLTEELYQYMLSSSLREPEILRKLREETSHDHMAHMQISPEQGQFMAFLVKLMGATKTFEAGVYTGYSSLCIALAIPPRGRIIACDINTEWTSVARRYWQEAGVSEKVSLYLAPALEIMDKLLAENHAGTFDFIFIDADKEHYLTYYERALEMVRPGGLIVIDNVFWSGNVLNPHATDKSTVAIQTLNKKLLHDKRILLSLIPIGDGLTLALKLH